MRTLIDDRADLYWGAKFLSLLLAIPLAGVVGLPILILLLFVFLCNPGGLGTRLSQWQFLKDIPGFHSGHPIYMAAVSMLYLLPLSILGMIVVIGDGAILGIWQ